MGKGRHEPPNFKLEHYGIRVSAYSAIWSQFAYVEPFAGAPHRPRSPLRPNERPIPIALAVRPE